MSSKDYESIISVLIREILKERLVIFLGSGSSIATELPSWEQILENIKLKYRIHTTETSPIKLASRIERSIGRRMLIDEISETFRLLDTPVAPIYDLLVELDVNIFITTNYHQMMEKAFRKKGIEPHIIYRDLDLASIKPSAKTIVKLYGSIDSPSSFVCTEKDYREYKTKHHDFNDWLKVKNTESTVLFLDTSYDDSTSFNADDHVIELFDQNKRNHVIILKKPKKVSGKEDLFQAEQEDFEDRCRIFESERGFLVLSVNCKS